MPAESDIEVGAVGFRHPGAGSLALDDVEVAFPAGGFTALVGCNGSGKTTLAKHLNGLLRPDTGEIRIGGADIAAREVGDLARVVGYVFQNPDHQIFNPTVSEEIAWGPRNLGLGDSEVRARTDEALARFGLEAVAARPPAVLGFGLRRKVAVASVFSMRTPVLVLDEPTAGLDAGSVNALMTRLEERARAGGTVILISHDLDTVAAWVPRTVVMSHGRILADAPTPEVFGDRDMLARAGLEAPRITRLGARLAPAGMAGPVLDLDAFCAAYAALRSRSRCR